jgi:hypothetical protein
MRLQEASGRVDRSNRHQPAEAKLMMAESLMSVFSHCMATRLNRFSLPIAGSMRACSLSGRFGKTSSVPGVFAAWDDRGDAARGCRGPVGFADIFLVRHLRSPGGLWQ